METEERYVLFVDDDRAYLDSVIRAINRQNTSFKCIKALNEHEALELAKRYRPGVIVLDLFLGEQDGTVLIPAFLSMPDPARILVLTGASESEGGIRCIEAGAASYLAKPVDTNHLIALIVDGLNVTALLRAAREQSQGPLETIAALGLSTRNEVMRRALEESAFAASSGQPVLLCGETGVGKGVIAQAIHNASKRSGKPFVRTQPHFGSHDLTMSELFGHMRGAFTGATDSRKGLLEEADGGTLFLDEVDALPQETQIALLHALQEKEFPRMGSNRMIRSDFRLIAATNTPHGQLVQASKLRPDFYHRIAQCIIEIPPLRERRADIPHLAQAFVNRLFAEDKSCSICGLSAEASAWLVSQRWPGNVRELQATIERGYAHAQFRNCTMIKPCDFQQAALSVSIETSTEGSLSSQLEAYELLVASTAFTKNNQNHSATARALGIDRKRLRRILLPTECKQ